MSNFGRRHNAQKQRMRIVNNDESLLFYHNFREEPSKKTQKCYNHILYKNVKFRYNEYGLCGKNAWIKRGCMP